MNLKSLQKLKSKTALKKKNLAHKLVKKNNNFELNILQISKPKLILLRSVERGYIFDNELIAFFKFTTKSKNFKKRLYVRCYPYLPTTKKPAEVRMGKGKGKIEKYCKPIFPGSVLAEMRIPKRVTTRSPFYLDCKKWLSEASKRFSLKTEVIGQDF